MRKGILPVLACLALAACGGSSNPGGTVKVVHPAPVSRASFTTQVSAICQKANSAFGVAKTHSGQVAVISHYLTVFRSIQAPSDLQALYARYLGVLSQELAALKRGDRAEVFRLAHSKAKPLVKQLGATGCVTQS